MDELKKFSCPDVRFFDVKTIIIFVVWIVLCAAFGHRSVFSVLGAVVLFLLVRTAVWYFTGGAAVMRFGRLMKELSPDKKKELISDFRNGELTLSDSIKVGSRYLFGKANGYIIPFEDIASLSYTSRESDKYNDDNPDYGCSILTAEANGKTMKLTDNLSSHACDIQWNILKEKLNKAHPEIKII